MARIGSVLVLCVDRDNDLGRKAGVSGPIVGRQANLNAAAKLALADPEDSDVNGLFAAVRKFDEVKALYQNAEIATLVGQGKTGMESDKKINEQLDAVMEKFPADGIVLVTDGAEDAQVIPILQSRAKIVSVETVVIKQAKQVEGAFYAIKEALKDPFLSKAFIGVPGIILVLLIALPFYGFNALQIIVGAIGVLMLLYGFGIYSATAGAVTGFTKSVSTQRVSFPFYIATLLVLAFGVVSAYSSFLMNQGLPIIELSLGSVFQLIFFIMLAAILFLLGKGIDAVHLKKAFYLRRYFLTGVSAILIWIILDSARTVFVGTADLGYFLLATGISFALFAIAFRASNALDVRGKITKLLVGLPVYNKTGEWVGKVEAVNAAKKSIDYLEIKTKKSQTAKKEEFFLAEGRIVLSS